MKAINTVEFYRNGFVIPVGPIYNRTSNERLTKVFDICEKNVKDIQEYNGALTFSVEENARVEIYNDVEYIVVDFKRGIFINLYKNPLIDAIKNIERKMKEEKKRINKMSTFNGYKPVELKRHYQFIMSLYQYEAISFDKIMEGIRKDCVFGEAFYNASLYGSSYIIPSAKDVFREFSKILWKKYYRGCEITSDISSIYMKKGDNPYKK